ncbi:MAG: proline dehydrogenase family protein [Chloroflexota bacterium]|nr:proline dehydrogenase family protein [Chloroflexota bacterium]
MLRSILIYLSQADWARRLVTGWQIAWRVASRFVAGETIDDAINALRVLNEKGVYGTLDHLGENITDTDDARKATDEIINALDMIDQAGVAAGVSVKLSQIGLLVGEDICEENLHRILERAKSYENFVRVDMEDSPVTDVTLKLFRNMRAEGFADTVGIVIQSYLYRSEEDVRKLMENGARVRLCKGAYNEPADVAFPKKVDADASYDRITEMLIDGAIDEGSLRVSACGHFPPIPAIATHDEIRIEHAKNYARKVDLPKEAMEFQMLYGIRRSLQEQIVAEGYPMRVYVPYGTEWYPYFVRRLAERPANLWFLISNFFRR